MHVSILSICLIRIYFKLVLISFIIIDLQIFVTENSLTTAIDELDIKLNKILLIFVN